MVAVKELEQQLKCAGCTIKHWGRAEMKELANVLLDGEEVKHCMNGQYEGGFCMLAATNLRVLLIDKKPMYLTLEDIRFDMIAEVDYNHNLLNATLRVFTPNQTLRFTGYNQLRLRNFFNFVQQRVMEIRQHYMMLEQVPPTTPVTSPQTPVSIAQSQQPSVDFSATATTATDQPQAAAPAPQQTAQSSLVSHLQVSMGGMRRVAPIITAYTHLPMMSRQRRFMGLGGVGART